jgi:hypothetical protein
MMEAGFLPTVIITTMRNPKIAQTASTVRPVHWTMKRCITIIAQSGLPGLRHSWRLPH